MRPRQEARLRNSSPKKRRSADAADHEICRQSVFPASAGGVEIPPGEEWRPIYCSFLPPVCFTKRQTTNLAIGCQGKRQGQAAGRDGGERAPGGTR